MKTKPNFQKINQTSCKWKTKPNNYAYLCSFNWSAHTSRTISFHSICFSFFRFFSTGLGDVHHRVAFVLVWKVWTRSVMRTYWTDSLMFYCVWLSLTKRWFGEIKKKIIPHMIFPYKRTTLHQIEWHSILMFNIYCLQSFLLSTLCFFFVFVIWIIFFFNSIVNPKVQQNGSESVPFQSVSNSFCFSVEKFTGHQHCTEFKWIIGRVIKLLLVCCLFCFDLPNRIHSDELVQFAVRMTRERERAYSSNKCWFCHLVQFTMLKSSIHNYTIK